MTSVLESLGWGSHEGFTVGARRVGRVVIMHGASAEVIWQEPDGAEGSGLCSLAKGLSRTPVAGDWVVVSDRRITEVLARRSELRRPHRYGGAPQAMAANVDVVMIVVSVTVDLNARLLERLAMMAYDSGATPVVVVTKVDETLDAESFCAALAQQIPDTTVLVTSSISGEGVDAVRDILGPGRTGVMLGASGVGKTSLLNALEGTSELTRAVSKGGEGRHATSTRKLYRLSSGGVLLDIPGIRLPEVVADQRALDEAFDDLEELALGCRFRNCRHHGDDGCAIEAAVDSGHLSESRLRTWREVQASMLSDLDRPRRGEPDR